MLCVLTHVIDIHQWYGTIQHVFLVEVLVGTSAGRTNQSGIISLTTLQNPAYVKEISDCLVLLRLPSVNIYNDLRWTDLERSVSFCSRRVEAVVQIYAFGSYAYGSTLTTIMASSQVSTSGPGYMYQLGLKPSRNLCVNMHKIMHHALTSARAKKKSRISTSSELTEISIVKSLTWCLRQPEILAIHCYH